MRIATGTEADFGTDFVPVSGAKADAGRGARLDDELDADFDADFDAALDAVLDADFGAGFAGFDADAALIGFEESLGSVPAMAGCACPNCVLRPRFARPAGAGSSGSSGSSGGGRIHRAVRNTCLATTVLAGAGVVGLTAGAGSAHAAAGKQGWDGSKYWFKNSAGEWRYTSHYDVYLNRTGQSGGKTTASGAASSGSSGSSGSSSSKASASKAPASNGSAASAAGKQGWDGSKYWFKNSSGEWRYTSHYDVYLNRTGQSGGGSAPAPDRPASRPDPDDAPDSGSVEAAIDYALAQLGKPYVWGGNGPSGFDCSGLVQQAYQRSGISLPRVADDQYAATTPIGAGQLRRGDLLFWSDSGRASGIHHVGIYLGGGKFVEAPRPGKAVRVSTISSGFYPTHFGRP
ncbi:C40 family peptidase [Kitasatospora sp. RG8]|uniref:C40 family peptidase n=1 Tax=Kitasatospora sp. RG8 TaxID=2820815 RepID=UPI001ADF8518|nr:C40 family peptidase [Kitasatospora sp. RG8]MBP0454547.1 C40 family peptidase [Kitasatospora sp. RG8]